MLRVALLCGLLAKKRSMYVNPCKCGDHALHLNNYYPINSNNILWIIDE